MFGVSKSFTLDSACSRKSLSLRYCVTWVSDRMTKWLAKPIPKGANHRTRARLSTALRAATRAPAPHQLFAAAALVLGWQPGGSSLGRPRGSWDRPLHRELFSESLFRLGELLRLWTLLVAL